MAISTYAELQTACANWLSRIDLTARIPEFIAMAEAKFQRNLRLRQMETRVTATAAEYMSLPTDYLEMRNIKLNTVPKVALKLIDPGFADAYYTAATDRPLYYALQGNEVRLVPAPDSTYTVEIDYFAKIPALSDSNTSNWLLTLAPDAYLYGTLLEALIEVQDMARAKDMASALKRVLDELDTMERQQRWSGAALVTRVDGPVL